MTHSDPGTEHDHALIGRTVGRYRVNGLLGVGGMGSVWRAYDTLLEREVALKFLPEALAASPEARKRFLREARAASQLHHPGIATVYDAGEDGGQVFIAMMLVEGETVAAQITRGRLPIAKAVHIAQRATEALGHAHEHGVLHRDLSSGNIMVTTGGDIVVVDFGLALPEGTTRLTDSGTMMGTVGYLAPEVVSGATPDRRSDLYGVGVVLFETLTGRLPFGSEPRAAVLYRIVHRQAAAPSTLRPMIPGRLDDVVLKLVAKDPADRYPDAATLAKALSGLHGLNRVDAREAQLNLGWLARLAARTNAGWRALRRASAATATFRRGARLRAVTTALLLASAFAIAGMWKFEKGPFAPVTPVISSVAVLPLVNKSRDPAESAHLAEGINEELVTKLGKLVGLRVIPWATSARYGDAQAKFPEVARELHVDGLVVGTFRKEEGRLYANVALISGKDGFQQWAEDFEEPASDLFVVQRKIAIAVAVQLKGALSGSERANLVRPAAHNVEAYEFYLRGAEALQSDDRESVALATSLFTRAMTLDPDLAEAYVGMGATLTRSYYKGDAGQRSLDEAEAHFRHALQLRPGVPGAERGLIRVNWENGRAEECLRIGRAAIQRAPDDIEALQTQAEAFCLSGMPERAIPALERVLSFDPENQAALWFLMLSQTWSWRAKEALVTAEAYVNRFGEDEETYRWIAVSQRRLGDLAAARMSGEKAVALSAGHPELLDLVAISDMVPSTRRNLLRMETWRNVRNQEEQILREHPDNLRHRSVFAYACAATGDLARFREEEARIIRELEDFGHSNEEAGLLAIAHLCLGEVEKARELTLWIHSMGDCAWPNPAKEPADYPPLFGPYWSLDRALAFDREVGTCLDDLRAKY